MKLRPQIYIDCVRCLIVIIVSTYIYIYIVTWVDGPSLRTRGTVLWSMGGNGFPFVAVLGGNLWWVPGRRSQRTVRPSGAAAAASDIACPLISLRVPTCSPRCRIHRRWTGPSSYLAESRRYLSQRSRWTRWTEKRSRWTRWREKRSRRTRWSEKMSRRSLPVSFDCPWRLRYR